MGAGYYNPGVEAYDYFYDRAVWRRGRRPGGRMRRQPVSFCLPFRPYYRHVRDHLCRSGDGEDDRVLDHAFSPRA